jgi:hypothetical protein
LNDVVVRDRTHNYDVRIARGAFAAIRREVLRMAGVAGPSCETGGLLLGQVDMASGVVWVTEADGPPMGSAASAEGLRINAAAARAAVLERRRRTRDMINFVGCWHTHPRHAAVESSRDVHAMEELTAEVGPALLMILGGSPEQWDGWLTGRGRPQMHVELVHPSNAEEAT